MSFLWEKLCEAYMECQITCFLEKQSTVMLVREVSLSLHAAREDRMSFVWSRALNSFQAAKDGCVRILRGMKLYVISMQQEKAV